MASVFLQDRTLHYETTVNFTRGLPNDQSCLYEGDVDKLPNTSEHPLPRVCNGNSSAATNW